MLSTSSQRCVRAALSVRPLFVISALILTQIFVMALTTASAQTVNRASLEQFQAQRAAQADTDRRVAHTRAILEGIPVRREYADGTVMELQRFDGNRPIYFITNNVAAADTVSTDEVHPGGSALLSLDGNGEVIGIWDGGNVRASHQEFTGRVVNQESAGFSDHATHVSGTMIAAGVDPSARGMAYEAQLRAWDFNSDSSEMAAQQLTVDPVRVSNHSYGLVTGWRFNFFGDFLWAWLGDVADSSTEDAGFGLYDQNAADWDQVASDAPYYLIVSSAGNDRSDSGPSAGSLHWHLNNGSFQLSSDSHPADGGADGYDSLGAGGGMAKNTLTVGAVEDVPGGYVMAPDVVMSTFSGWGPTDDLRIKPDLVANGVQLFSSLAGSDIDYGIFSGTSMSSPNAAGSIALLQEHAKELNGVEFRASTFKALVIHTADEAGDFPGPDPAFGFGLLNTRRAAELLSEDSAAGGNNNIREINLQRLDTFTTTVENDGSTPLKVTIAWTDLPGTPPPASVDPTDRMLVNDLNLRVIDPNGFQWRPWAIQDNDPLFSVVRDINDVDTVEQVLVDLPVQGTYTIEVSSINMQTPQQWVSLVVSGESETPTAPAFTSAPNTSATVGQPYNYDADNRASASGTGPITFSLDSGPAGFSVAPDGLISWTPSPGQEGPQDVSILATNAVDQSVQSYTITVTGIVQDPPVITSVPNTTATVGEAYSYDADSTLEATGNTPITYSLVSGPAGFSVSSAGVVAWTPSTGQEGPQAVTIQANNSIGTDTQSYTIDVSPAPLVSIRVNAGGGAFTAAGGDEFDPDSSFVGGTAGTVPTPVAGTTDDLLYQQIRYGGSFSYAFDNLPASNYRVTLYLVEPSAAGGAVMDISVEGALSLDNLSVAAAAGGTDLALQTEVNVLVTDGTLNLDFDVVSGLAAFVSAIAVQQTAPPPSEPNISVSASSLDFGSVTVGSSAQRSVTVSNTGNADLTVQSLSASPAAFSVDGPGTPVVISPAGSTAVTVSFTPSAEGAETGSLVIASNDPDQASVSVTLSGSGQTLPSITSTPTTSATVGEAYAYDGDSTLEASGTAPITFALDSGPAGFTVSTGGVVSWTPAEGQEGTQAVVITATNSAGSDTQSFNVEVSPAPSEPPVITSTPSTAATVDEPYAYDADNTVSASGPGPITYSLDAGPAGFSVAANGLVSWTPSAGQEGLQAVVIRATNDDGFDTQSFNINVSPAPTDPPVITSTPATAATVGQAYAYDADSTVEASGGLPVTFSLDSGPAGFSVSASGVVAWTPAAGQEGDQSVTIRATNDDGFTTQSFTISVAPAPLVSLRINAGGGAFTAANSDEFAADSGFSGGTSGTFPTPVGNTTDDLLYQQIRYGASFSYSFDSLPAGTYQVTLFLAEPSATGGGNVMDVSAEGNVVLNDYNVASNAGGSDLASQAQFTVSVTDGELNLSFSQVSGLAAFVGAISVQQQ